MKCLLKEVKDEESTEIYLNNRRDRRMEPVKFSFPIARVMKGEEDGSKSIQFLGKSHSQQSLEPMLQSNNVTFFRRRPHHQAAVEKAGQC